MSDGEGEYEVESILRAKVVRKKSRKAWLYWVKWKGYDLADNTWEPVDSFANGSEHFIDHFWNRVSTNDRDYKDLNQFTVNEEFFPSGPPRRKKARKVPEEVEIPHHPPAVETRDSENEVRSIIDVDEDPPASTAVTTRSKRRRSSAAADAESSPPKRKRGRPPGKRPEELEAEEAEKALRRTRSVPELPRTKRVRGEPAEASTSVPSHPPLPRTRGRKSQTAPRPSSLSPDELLLSDSPSKPTPIRGKKKETRVTRAAQDDRSPPEGPDASAMIVDDSQGEEELTFGVPTLLTPELAPAVATGSGHSSSLPAHRTRAANPRVKVLDDPNLTEETGGISVKARFMKRAAESNGKSSGQGGPSTSRRISTGKAGPGRSSSGFDVGSSRLVAVKGKLTTVKAKARPVAPRGSQEATSKEHTGDDQHANSFPSPVDVNEVPGLGQYETEHGVQQPPLSAKELLKVAGMDVSAGDELPDFEEDAEGEDDIEYIENHAQVKGADASQPQNGEASSAELGPAQSSTEQVDEPVPEQPPVVLEARPVTFTSRVASAWSHSTIFGPLALGLSPIRKQVAESSTAPKRYAFNVNLDAAVSVPIILKDTHAQQTFLEKLDATARNPTGKFYKDQAAFDLVDSFRSQGSYARVVPNDDASEDHKKHFERFLSRLVAGELFVQMNHFEPLVIFASENSGLGQKLGLPGPLLGLASSVVVAHVSIEDHCAYAEAAVHADNARW
ncbi:hypothetical protein C8Q78DRAFT_1035963 [Trametes maxima]|nr:hypothetical protein C8Q78DRAFT_1035963 [Trametes maxima]